MESDIPPRPHITPELIDYLKAVFPDKAPSIFDDDRMIWCKVGQVDVVRHLNMILQEQIEHQLGTL